MTGSVGSSGAAYRHIGADVIEGARSGDPECWRRIVSSFQAPLVRAATAWGADSATASDLVQQTWVSAYRHIGGLRDERALGGWLRMILRREFLRESGRRARETVWEALETDPTHRYERAGDDQVPESVVLRTERHQLVRRAVTCLPQRDRQLLALLAESPAPAYREVSRRLGIPMGSIGPTRCRCFGRLRRELAKLGVDGE